MSLNMCFHVFYNILRGEYAYDWDSELAGTVINGFSIGRVLMSTNMTLVLISTLTYFECKRLLLVFPLWSFASIMPDPE